MRAMPKTLVKPVEEPSKIIEQPEKKHIVDEEEQYESNNQPQQEPEPDWLKTRRKWLRTLSEEDRTYIATYGFELWEQKTGRKRDV
jgi:hypothetical protein